MDSIQITITKEDRKQYSAKNTPESSKGVAVLKKTDTSLEVASQIDLPRLPTIGDMKLEGTLSNDLALVVGHLSAMYPKATFDNVTSKEASELATYNEQIKNMKREDIWKIIKPYFPSVFGDILGDKLPKMSEIQIKSDKDPNYTPTMEWLTEISRRLIHMRKDLFKYNIDFGLRIFDYNESPISYLLMLIKSQKEFYPKRHLKLSDAFFVKVQSLIQKHSELILKLKLLNRTGDDFYGSKYPKTRDGLKILKTMMYLTFQGKPLTIKQQSLLINIIDDYKKSLDMIFIVNPDDQLLYESQVSRPKANAELASLEVYNVFDDSSHTRKGFTIKGSSSDVSACEIINSIFMKEEYKKPTNMIYKNTISVQALKDYIGQYFSFATIGDRSIIKGKSIAGLKNAGQVKIGTLFFDILDSYMP